MRIVRGKTACRMSVKRMISYVKASLVNCTLLFMKYIYAHCFAILSSFQVIPRVENAISTSKQPGTCFEEKHSLPSVNYLDKT